MYKISVFTCTVMWHECILPVDLTGGLFPPINIIIAIMIMHTIKYHNINMNIICELHNISITERDHVNLLVNIKFLK